MAENEPRRIGVSIELKPHAYDPLANPELFDGVMARRVIAFVIDLVILSIPVVLGGLFIFHRQKVKSTVAPEDVPTGVNT